MIGVTLEVNGRVFEQYIEDVSALPQAFMDVLANEYVPAENIRWAGLLNNEPGPVRLPFQFASDASRIFYLAAKRKGELPNVGPDGYERTGAARQWKVEGRQVDANTYEVWLVNPTPHATFPYGPRQVQGHVNTGWPNVYLTLAEERSTSAVNAISLFGRTILETR